MIKQTYNKIKERYLNENMIEFTIKSEYSFSDDTRNLIDTLIVDESFLLPIICALAKY